MEQTKTGASLRSAIRPMTIEDYDAVLAFWRSVEGVGLSSADEREPIARYLARNPGMSMVVYDDGGAVVGAALCGHDGRRGLLHHVAVRADLRGQGLGTALVERCLEALRAEGIDKCHLFVFADNQVGRAFWQRTGWRERVELVLMSKNVD